MKTIATVRGQHAVRGLLTWALVLAACGLITLATNRPADAADLGRPGSLKDDPRPFPGPQRRGPSIWNGVYWGLAGGYGFGQSDHNYDRNDNHGLASQDVDGGLANVTLGYNTLVSQNFLLGLEADFGVMDLSADDKVIFDGHVWKTQFGPFWGTLRARAGVVWGPALLYATGGLAFMMVDEVGYGDADGQTAENQDVRSGWTLGGGIEFAFAPGMTTKLEYLHMDFGRYDGLSENQEEFYFDNTVDIIRAGLNFKF